MDFSLHPGALGVHDYGGQEDDGDDNSQQFHPAAAPDRAFALWESQVHAVAGLLVGKGLITLDELRRGIESLPKEQYSGGLSYYEKWASSLLALSLERGTVSQEEVDAHLGPPVESCEEPVFTVGTRVQVRAENIATRWRRPINVQYRRAVVFQIPRESFQPHIHDVNWLLQKRAARVFLVRHDHSLSVWPIRDQPVQFKLTYLHQQFNQAERGCFDNATATRGIGRCRVSHCARTV